MRMSKQGFFLIFLLVLLSTCGNRDPLFKKLDGNVSHVTFKNQLTPTEDFNIIDYLYFYNGGGVAIGDINQDGLPDLYFSGNQVPNKLYLNKGDLKFEDITETAGVAGTSTWKTGSVMADVNADGLLDIYVCAVVGLKNLNGHNELFINNGNNTFSERSAEYGLNFESYSSSAAFLDYDLDGDLDLYLLNHAIHTERSFGHANLRNVRTYESGGKLLRNEGGKFLDVSEQAKIYGGINGYGLGVAIADFNVDGYPDIFVGNDFHEDDYYYINNGDGTFSEQGKLAFVSMSKFSMGNDAADINHDGFPDLITLDMLPEDEEVLKRSVDEENINILKIRTGQYGYHYQFPRNMMHVNQGDGTFAETALISNVAATDWSWSALFSDYDQDGNQDLFISNGIPRRPNDLDYIKYVSSEQVVNTIGSTKLVDQKVLMMMPPGQVRNYVFKGSGGYLFEDKSAQWLPDEKTCSTASAYGDLDNDGDLDLVVNNVDDQAGIYVNETNDKANYLKIKFKYTSANPMGIGTKVYSYHRGVLQMKELYTVRGFQASSEPLIHFGYGNEKEVDSIKIVWPNRRVVKLTKVQTNQLLIVSPDQDTVTENGFTPPEMKPLFLQVDGRELGLTFVHREDDYTDFDRLKLLPYQQSDKGPATALGDLNNDGKTDIYFGGSKRKRGAIFLQSEKGFISASVSAILKDSLKENIEAVIADFNGDEKNDLFIGTGGADFYGTSRPLLDSYYEASGSDFTSIEIPDYYENAACVKAFDFDGDGDKDIFVGNESVSNDFGAMPRSCLLMNEKGKFTPTQKNVFEKLGMVTDAVWYDYNGDGQTDLIVVGEWMAPTFLKNKNGAFSVDDASEKNLNGLWQSISAFDIDHDGDMDFVLGNWGLNSKFKASEVQPMKMYYNDFDGNGNAETVVAIAKNGNYYPLDGLDALASQINNLRKKFGTYKDFSGKTVADIFSDARLEKSIVYNVHQLASGYLQNNNGNFEFVPFPPELQLSPILDQLSYDFDSDGKEELLVGGNYFGLQPFHGRLGSFPGALIETEKEVISGQKIGLKLIDKSVRHFNVFEFNGHKYLLVTINNDKPQVYELLK
jgi:enediyne biosynthesis protein E4